MSFDNEKSLCDYQTARKQCIIKQKRVSVKKIDIAIIGSGIGGAFMGLLNKDKNIIVFEQSNNLGGSACTFERFGYKFNSGATTFMGYEYGNYIKEVFDNCNIKPDLIKSDIAFQLIQKDKNINVGGNFEDFLIAINDLYPNKNNNLFWSKIRQSDKYFWEIKDIYYAKYSFLRYAKTLQTSLALFRKFGFLIFKSGDSFIRETLGDISSEYLDFINSILQITIQTNIKNSTFLTMSLGLSYPFHDLYYANGGMGEIINNMLKETTVHKNEKIVNIIKREDCYEIISNKSSYLATKIVLNSTVFDSVNIFSSKKTKSYYKNFKTNNQSAFVVYMKLKVAPKMHHHYQIVLNELIPNCISKSLFVSFSDTSDEILSKDGLSVTISTHTTEDYWLGLDKKEYIEQKEFTQDFIQNAFLQNFDTIYKEDILHIFSATSKTFKRYIGRSNCGGVALSFKNILNIPSPVSKFKNVYNIGDTVFAQGWSGVALNAKIIQGELNAVN